MSTRTRSSTARGIASNPAASRSTRTNNENKARAKDIYCTCRGPDDGSPMVHCACCKEWYHFRCVDLDEETAHDIDVYICPTCTQRTGRKSVMTWEGRDGYESPTTTQAKQKPTVKAQSKQRKRVKKEEDDPAEELPSESPESSDDEYVDVGKPKRSRKTLAYESGSDSDNVPNSPHLKRKSSAVDKKTVKRRKSVSTEELDPARKYCLGKLDELFCRIFIRYPPDEGAEEEALRAKAGHFAAELEACVFQTYAEPDKHNILAVGQKYKARFNTLQFNLSKDDRVSLHKGIASGDISAAQLAIMSSTDLANEQMRQSIQIAEKEALEHSILKKAKVPTAKITHKGLENIEDQGGVLVTERNAQLELEQAEEERRERERLMRIKLAEEHQRQRTSSVSVPPESPVVSHQAWDSPSAASPQVGDTPVSPTVGLMRPPPNPLFVHIPSEQARELELSLDDIINVEEATPEGASSQTVAPTANSPTVPQLQSPVELLQAVSLAAASTEPSFSLNSLWNAPPPSAETSSPPSTTTKIEAPAPDSEAATAAADHDFDMFLEDKPEHVTPPQSKTPPIEKFKSSPQVWSGIISMPLDSSIPQDTQVIARQAGGRPLAPDAPHWKVLFPTGTLRIDGRVPVENSLKFLVQMRLNPSKEMICAAFSPATESAEGGFKMMSDFLINKNRHGLIFPWGNRPKEHHPGRELYIIPLLSSEPLPECIELLDNLKLPKERTENYFVGIWIVGRGKLDTAAAHVDAPVPPPPIAPPQHATLSPTHHPTPPPGPTPPFAPLQQPTTPHQVEHSALAAEVASLTPDQIQAMLQMLAASSVGQNISPPPPPQHAAPIPPAQQPQWQQPPPHPPHPPPPGPGYYGPPPHPQYAMYPPTSQHNETQHYPGPGPGYGHLPHWDQPGPGRGGGYGADKGDRGGRGRGGHGSNRGRRSDGRGGRGGRGGHRAQDSGWPKRKGPDNY